MTVFEEAPAPAPTAGMVVLAIQPPLPRILNSGVVSILQVCVYEISFAEIQVCRPLFEPSEDQACPDGILKEPPPHIRVSKSLINSTWWVRLLPILSDLHVEQVLPV